MIKPEGHEGATAARVHTDDNILFNSKEISYRVKTIIIIEVKRSDRQRGNFREENSLVFLINVTK